MNLESLRSKIDEIDREIVDRLNDRVKLAAEVGRLKSMTGAEVYVPGREEEIMRKLAALTSGPLDEQALRAIYREVISAAKAVEKEIVIAYLGPEATYTHQAAVKNFGSSLNYQPLRTIPDVFAATERNEADYGVIPIENSTEGAVFHSLDLLLETDLKIVAQIYLEIAHCLISSSSIEEITSVHSKDQALAQCRQWLDRRLPDAERVDAESTAAAVQLARDQPDTAAIAGRIASDLYGVPVVVENIQDELENVTRFLVIGKQSSPPLGDGREKSSFVFSLRDEAGALLKALQPFASRGVNLCKIESRPSRRKLWDYYFFIDVIGHFDDPPVRESVAELEAHCAMIKWLGSYPNTSL